VDRILFAPSGGRTWQDRVASLTRLAQPEQLASILASGMAAGKAQREIANDLLPAVNNVRSSARRIARTEGLRVAHAVQMDAHEQLGDLKIGYQIRAQLDQNTRPWHASRSGTIYYDQPTATQKGPAQRPNPPEEALDPSERPAGTPQLAHNCRCSLSPVLAPPPEIADDPAKLAVFQNNAGSVIPDPADYAEWFSTADQRRRRIAVGSRRYDVVAGNLSDLRVPEWDDFLDPDTGDLVSLSRLKAESAAERAERTAKAKALIAERARLIRTTSTFGFLPS
jgi:SPP1 gp7 family putative phage head morphogenesis protein